MPFPDLLHVLASHRQSVPQQCVAWAHLLSGQMVSEQKVASEPEALCALDQALGLP